MKHVGKMKNNSARIAIIYRTLPGDANSALVVGTNGLPDSYHDSLMSTIETDSGQQASELADLLSVRRFPDGEIMLSWLHNRGHLRKVPTSLVIMTPNSQTQIPLDELNKLIAEQAGISIDELAVTDGSKKTVAKKPTAEAVEVIVPAEVIPESTDPLVKAKSYRSQADKLAKEAANFRRLAEELDPAVKKSKNKTTA